MMTRMEPREAFCHLLAAVYASDGILTEAEKQALVDAMNEHGLDDSERKRVLNLQGHEAALETMKARPVEDRQLLVDELVAAALADGKLTPQETATVTRLGKELGVG